jgi:large subunit ribosomal protein L21
MYAIVKTGGKQYRVEKGQKLLVERLTADEGATVALEPVLVRSDEISFGDALSKATVSAKVLGHERGPKLRVFKFKPKRGYKKLAGHRQELTRLEVTDISTGGKSYWRTRRASAPPATAATPTPSAWGSRSSPGSTSPAARSSSASAAPGSTRARASASARTTRCSPRRRARWSSRRSATSASSTSSPTPRSR